MDEEIKPPTTGDPARCAAPYGSGIELGRMIESIPRAVRQKMSLANIHDIVKNYNGCVAVDTLKPDTHVTMAQKLRWLADDAGRAVMHPLATTLEEMADEVEAGA